MPGVHSLAVWSYSIYLTHKAVGFVVKGHAKHLLWSPTVTLVVTVALSLLVGALLYWLVEAPFMALRQHHFKSNFAPQQGRAVAAG